MQFQLSLCAGLLSFLVARASGLALHEELHDVPTGWSFAGEADEAQSMSLKVALTMQNMEKMVRQLYSVSTPGDACYGQHMDRDDVHALVAPSDESNQAVLAWAKQSGAKEVSSDGYSVSMKMTVGEANKMLGTSFAHYDNSGVRRLRTTQYSVPEALSKHVDIITPTTYFGKVDSPKIARSATPVKRDEVSKPVVASSCETSITPMCLMELYNTVGYTPDAKSGSRIGFGSFLNQSARYEDLFLFESFYGIKKQNFSVELIRGATNDQSLKTAQIGEANLDVQNIIGLANPLPVTEFITGGSPPFIPNLDEPTPASNENEPYLAYYTYLMTKTNKELPLVISNSYGDDEQTVPPRFANRVCSMIGTLGLRGITIFESAGDTGVGAPCQSNNGKKTPQFTPQFPGTCPYITAVGGTQSVKPEIAWLNGSGGFSNYFTRPSYQDLAINNYFDNNVKPKTLKYLSQFFNMSGRGFPDVSAHSLRPDYQVIYDKALSPSGGTSAASPVWAAVVGLLNDALLRAGKSQLGFLNPMLYSSGVNSLNDITEGGSVGCTGVNAQSGMPIKGASVIPYASWNATTGWDPVTGLGTPNFGKLKDLVLGMSASKRSDGACKL